MSIYTIWESVVYNDTINKYAKFTFIEESLLDNCFKKSLLNPDSRINKNQLYASLLVERIIPNEIGIDINYIDNIHNGNVVSALAFCISGGLKNKELKRELIENSDIRNQLHKYLPHLDRNKYIAPFDYYLPSIIKDLPDFGLPNRYLDIGYDLLSSESIPFINSPLSAESLSNLLKSSPAVGLGAYIGYLIIEPSPLLLLTIPAGMILFGGASGVAKGLEDGLKRKIVNYLLK